MSKQRQRQRQRHGSHLKPVCYAKSRQHPKTRMHPVRKSARSLVSAIFLMLAPYAAAQGQPFGHLAPAIKLKFTLGSEHNRYRTSHQKFSIALGANTANNTSDNVAFGYEEENFKDLLEFSRNYDGESRLSLNGGPHNDLTELLGLTEQERRKRKSKRRWLIAGGVVGAVLIGGTIFLVKVIEADRRTD